MPDLWQLIVTNCSGKYAGNVAYTEAIHGDIVSVTYGQVLKKVERLSASILNILEAQRTNGGHHSFSVLLPNCTSHVDLFFAAAATRAKIVCLNHRLMTEELQLLFERGHSPLLFASEDFAQFLSEVSWASVKVRVIAWVHDIPDDFNEPLVESLSMLSLYETNESFQAPPVQEDTWLQGFFTSGSTGAPKSVSHTHKNVYHHTLSTMQALGINENEGDCWGHFGPLFHCGTPAFIWISAMVGARQVFHENQFQFIEVANMMQDDQVTMVKLMPTILKYLLSAEKTRSMKFHKLKWVLTGGMKPTLDVIETNATNLEGLQLHCEKYLKKIRELFQVPRPEEILEMNHINLSTAEEGTGQSGAKMLFSNDKKFIIKTMSARDLGAFLNVVEKYTAYMTMHASESAMMRYYAILEDDRGGFWLIANNWLPVKFPVLFDLKGSMVGRTNGITESDQKDKDWLKQNLALVLPPGERAVALQSLKKDSLWLARAKLIDYSLIAGLLYYQLDACDGPSQAWCIAPVCHPKGGCGEAAYTLGEYFNQIKDFYCEETSVKEKQFGHTCVGGITSSLKVYFQCFGIIDLLKPFDMKSRAEYTVKAGWGRQISAQPANSYARRFDQFMVEKVFRKSWSDSTAPLVFTDQTCLDWGSIDMWGD